MPAAMNLPAAPLHQYRQAAKSTAEREPTVASHYRAVAVQMMEHLHMTLCMLLYLIKAQVEYGAVLLQHCMTLWMTAFDQAISWLLYLAVSTNQHILRQKQTV